MAVLLTNTLGSKYLFLLPSPLFTPELLQLAQCCAQVVLICCLLLQSHLVREAGEEEREGVRVGGEEGEGTSIYCYMSTQHYKLSFNIYIYIYIHIVANKVSFLVCLIDVIP